jgi:predicted metal-dependent hydrolase
MNRLRGLEPVIFTTAAGQAVPVEICRRKGTRHLRLRLGAQNQIVASAPWRTGERAILQFVERQREWLETQLRQVPQVSTLLEWLTRHPHLTASGECFPLRLEPVAGSRAQYLFEADGSRLVLRLPGVVDEPGLRALVLRFARDALACRLAYQAKRLRLRYSALSVRDQASRWGSCSALGGISLNWRLVLLEPELQDYIILHELAHLTEMNHSRRFWALLERYDPERVAHEAALDAVSSALMRVGRRPENDA